MAAITFGARYAADGSLAIPREAVETLELHPGDEITVRIETGAAGLEVEQPSQAELRSRIARIFDEADKIVRVPGKALTDPYEAEWAAGVEEKARRIGIKL